MLKCSTSLWSADLSNLAAEIRRVEPYSDRFHLDVADGHYVKNLLFFPDLVKALRPHARLPFEVHLMVTEPAEWVQPFADAGANTIIFCLDSASDPRSVLQTIRNVGLRAGVSLQIGEPAGLLESLWGQLDIVTLMGTALGIKGASMDSSIPAKVRQIRQVLSQRKLPVEIEVDGGIRRETVPALKAAGTNVIVPGSLMFREDPRQMREWLDSL